MAGKAIKQLSSGGSGQSLSDRMTSAKHIISGSGLGRAVCKATTEEIIAPKKKHLGYLIECTNQSNVSIPELANALLERLSSSNWVVVFKALVSIHSVMNYGNERFTQYLASNNCNLSLRNFYDKSSVQGADMSRFICRYSAYVQEKAFAYRSLAYDLCKVKRGSDDGALRTQSVEKLLRSLPVLIAQFDALLGFDATPSELSNPIINAALALWMGRVNWSAKTRSNFLAGHAKSHLAQYWRAACISGRGRSNSLSSTAGLAEPPTGPSPASVRSRTPVYYASERRPRPYRARSGPSPTRAAC
uniref:ENTH domain-containing protein n=1 Tax=Macrostomum lignano TaxID=282301 RepID=A0A1I8GR57_9PLAT